MPDRKAIIANFSPHQLSLNPSNVEAFDRQFGAGNWEVVGSIPVVADIGDFDLVKSIVQLWTVHVLPKKPTHIYVNCNSIFNGLIFQVIEAFPELQVPRLMWDVKRMKWWPAPPPLSRQDRMNIETRSLTVPREVSEWFLKL